MSFKCGNMAQNSASVTRLETDELVEKKQGAEL
jgi:hypothetical protein